jgi:hypothetical protein
VAIVFDPKSFLLQIHGEIRLSFNKIQFWNNTHTHTHTHSHTHTHIHIYAKYILNIYKNYHLITLLDEALLEMPVFLGM